MGRARGRQQGFTLVEQLVIVAVIGTLAAIAVPSFLFVLRRERVNALAFHTAGWLEGIRSIAAREVNPDAAAGGCAIEIAASQTNARAGDLIASLRDCTGRDQQLQVPDTWGGTFQIAHSVAGGASSFTLFFTPRGMWSSAALMDVDDDLEIRIAPADGAGPRRCVRLSSILGSIDIGSARGGGVASGCDTYARI